MGEAIKAALVQLSRTYRIRGGPYPWWIGWAHDNAIDGAGGHAQPASRAVLSDHGVHLFERADDGIHWTCADTDLASDAQGFINDGDGKWCLDPVGGVERHHRLSGDRRQPANAGRPAWRTTVDGYATRGNGLRIGPAAGVAAALALRLRQNRVNGVG